MNPGAGLVPATPVLPVAVLVVAAGVLGLIVGSFANVVVWRVPRGQSVVRPRSACPRCDHPLRWYDEVPVVSWLVLRARCRDCRAPISARYPLVELVTGAGFAATAAATGWSWLLLALLYLVAIAVPLVLIDLDVHRLPDAIVLPSYAVTGLLLVLAAANPGGAGTHWADLRRAGIGCVAMLVVYLLPLLVWPGGMGLGDVKLAGVLGMYLGWFGWGALAVGWFAAYLLGGLFSVALLVAGRAGRRSRVPFGPWMVAGVLVGLTLGEAVAGAYVGAFA